MFCVIMNPFGQRSLHILNFCENTKKKTLTDMPLLLKNTGFINLVNIPCPESVLLPSQLRDICSVLQYVPIHFARIKMSANNPVPNT